MVKELPVSAEDMTLILRLERSRGEGNDKSLQYSCLENPMDRGKPHGKSMDKSHGLTGYSPWGHKRVGHDLAIKQQQ